MKKFNKLSRAEMKNVLGGDCITELCLGGGGFNDCNSTCDGNCTVTCADKSTVTGTCELGTKCTCGAGGCP